MQAFLGAHERQQRTQRLGDAIAARMAQAPGPKWKEYAAGLRKRGN